jgi:hypothetical protein
MKNKFLNSIIPVLTITVLGYADQTPTLLGLPKQDTPKEKKATGQKEPPFIQYHNRIVVFAPNHQGYERIKPNAFYVGVEGFFVPVLNREDGNFLLDAELRMGYNFFFKQRHHFTPFAGVGFVQDFIRYRHNHFEHKPGIMYGTTGFLYTYETSDVTNVGINAKFIVGDPLSEKHFDWGTPVIGADIALPVTFRFGRGRHWDYRLEPFYMYLHGSNETQDYLGFRSTVGYRF